MCGTCGCGEHHHHDHHHDEGKVITLEQDILQRNNLLAERNRGYFEAKHIFCLNLMSSPGSGKTTLLEETIRRLSSGVVRRLPSQSVSLKETSRPRTMPTVLPPLMYPFSRSIPEPVVIWRPIW